MYIAEPQLDTLVTQISQLTTSPNTLAVILIGEKTNLDLPALIQALKQQGVIFVGGVFPGVIVNDQWHESGVVITTLPLLSAPVIIQNLNQRDFTLAALEPLTRSLAGVEGRPAALVLVDGLTTNIELFLARLFTQFKNKVTYIGGGAGSLSFQQKPCIFDSSGVYQDAALVVLIQAQAKIGVRHGWRDLRGPFRATQTQGNIVLKLDNEPAFKKYSEIIKLVTGKVLTKENFFDIAKGFPLGLFHRGIDRIVRDPIAFTDEGGLVCVGLVPENSFVFMLSGNPKSLIDHARQAATEAMRGHQTVNQCLVVDCISRVLYLQEKFPEELNGVLNVVPSGVSSLGMLTLGEIGSYTTGTVEFFNKTIIVCALQRMVAETPIPTAAHLEKLG